MSQIRPGTKFQQKHLPYNISNLVDTNINCREGSKNLNKEYNHQQSGRISFKNRFLDAKVFYMKLQHFINTRKVRWISAYIFIFLASRVCFLIRQDKETSVLRLNQISGDKPDQVEEDAILPSSISTICHCCTPTSRSIIINSRSQTIIQPCFNLSINCSRENELQIENEICTELVKFVKNQII